MVRRARSIWEALETYIYGGTRQYGMALRHMEEQQEVEAALLMQSACRQLLL